VHIALTRFNQVTYSKSTQTAIVGAGLTWDVVYEKIAKFGVNVVGGRISGVGVSGFTLGGGMLKRLSHVWLN
jgi:FAD/FMN-containing dehydrogenase